MTLNKLEEKGIETSILYIDSYQDKYSYLKSNNNSINLKKLIAKLNYLDQEYCVVEANKGYSIGMFKNEGISLNETNDHNLHTFLQYFVNECNFRWTSCYYTGQNIKEKKAEQKKNRFYKILYSHQFKILSPMDHLSKSSDENVRKLTDRILKRLK